MPQQFGHASNDTQPQTKPRAMAVASRAGIVQAGKILEDGVLAFGGDSYTGINDLNRHMGALAAASQQHAAAFGVTQGVGEQIAQYAFEQHSVAGHPSTGAHDFKG